MLSTKWDRQTSILYPFHQAVGIIAKKKVERLDEPKAVDDYKRTLFPDTVRQLDVRR